MFKRFVFTFLLLAPVFAVAQPAGCESESGLAGRSDVLLCENWSSSVWWQNGYYEDGELTTPATASSADNTVTQSNCFNGGPCLKVNINSCASGGGGGSLAHQKPIPGNPDEVWLRYYLKLDSTFSPANFVVGDCGTSAEAGGKFPGLGDPTTDADPGGQCGNGGAFSDGLQCWTARLKYRACDGSGGANICGSGTTSASTRLGFYWYLPPATSATNQSFGAFDNVAWGTEGGPCSTTTELGGTGSDGTSCGQGTNTILNDVWYRVEIHIKMNTVGSQNGVAEAYIDGTLKYRKTNVEYRYSGNRGLHIRNLWLDVHTGGEGVGPASATAIYLARLAICSKRCGKADQGAVSNPFTVNVN